MDRIPQSPPVILPIAAAEPRPLWSVMIPAYNCAVYLPDALRSVLAQDPGQEQMQIEVVDDVSSDADVEALVREVGRGRVKYFRQPENRGSLRNFETCLNRARGHLVHLLHGDDRVRPGFYGRLASLFQQYPQAGSAFSRYAFINEAGGVTHLSTREETTDSVLEQWFPRIAGMQRVQYAAMVVRREVYEKLGSFYGMPYGEDWEMWARIAKFFPVAYTPEVLAEYRLHAGSMSRQLANSGQSLTYLLKSHSLIERLVMDEDVPEKEKRKIIRNGKQHCALYSIALAKGVFKETNNEAMARKYIRAALRISKNAYVRLQVLKFYVKSALSKFRFPLILVLGNHFPENAGSAFQTGGRLPEAHLLYSLLHVNPGHLYVWLC